MPTALDNEVKSKHQALKPFSYGQGQTCKKDDVLDTSKWSGLAVGRMVRNGFLLEVSADSSVKESDPYKEPKKEELKAEVKAEEPKEDAEEPDKTAKKKGFFKKKKDA